MSVLTVHPDPNAPEPVAADGGPRTAAVTPHEHLIACEECDLVYERQPLGCHQLAKCPRCHAVVERGHRLGMEGQLALGVTSLVIYLLAVSYPIVTLDLRGVRSEATIGGALLATWNQDQQLVAIIAAVTVLLAPLSVIVLRLYVTGALLAGRVPPLFGTAMALLRYSARWSMVEVFMLGTLVSIVRVAGLASVIPGVGIFSFGILTFLMASLEASGTHGLWACAGAIRARATA